MKKEALKVRDIEMELIDRPENPDRLTIDPEYIKELAASIAEVGLMSPILLSPRAGRFEIVAGDCRYQAFLALGRDKIAAIVTELDPENVSIARATENLQRQDLTVIEEARIYRKLHDVHNMTWEQIAKRTGKKASTVKRISDLLQMPDILTKAVHERKISYVAAEELYRLRDLAKIEYYLGFCIDHGASTRIVADWVKDELSRPQTSDSNVDRGSWGSALGNTKPVYVPCDLCAGPMVIGTESTIRCCTDCADGLRELIKKQG